MTRILFILLVSLMSVTTLAQNNYVSVLNAIEQNNPTLRTARAVAEADRTEATTGLNLPNPEVELGYLWGAPGQIGDRKDVSVSQSFDFPTAYRNRRLLSTARKNETYAQYSKQRMEVLLEAKKLCVDLIYQRMVKALYLTQYNRAISLTQTLARMDSLGQLTAIDVNKNNVHIADLNNLLADTDREIASLLTKLRAMNGGEQIEFTAESYSDVTLPADFRTWYSEVQPKLPSIAFANGEIETARQAIKLEKSLNLPKFSLGYMGEFIPGQNFQGVTFGVSIPLWENKNKVKTANLRLSSAQMRLEEEINDADADYRRTYDEALILQQNAERMKSALEKGNNEELLYKAYSLGQITFLTYLLELDYFNGMYLKYLNTLRDLNIAESDLSAPLM